MELKILRIAAVCCIVSVQNLFACGWSENSETIRLALFKAEARDMQAFRPFYYTADYNQDYTPDPENKDKIRNCSEWQKRLGADVPLNDIFVILYHSAPELFELARQNHTLGDVFPQNKFIRKILSEENKPILDYLSFAKEMEYLNFDSYTRWERWEQVDRYGDFSKQKGSVIQSYINHPDLVTTIHDLFLQKRYAFLLLRYNCQTNKYREALTIYHTYFENKSTSSILDVWALLFKAMAMDDLGDHLHANYLYSLVFDLSDEKKLIALQCFNRKKEVIEKTLATTSRPSEKAVILAMTQFRNPGPALEMLKQINSLAPNSVYLPPLIMREINKIEDWLFTPKFTQYGPSIDLRNFKDWEYGKIREKNLHHDLSYVNDLKLLLQQCHAHATIDYKDFLSISLAHLNFIEDSIAKGNEYLQLISAKANPSIRMQKSIDIILLALKSHDVASKTLKDLLLATVNNLEFIGKKQPLAYKNLYSLLRIASAEYEKINDYAIAGLLFTKSERYKNQYESTKNGYDTDYSDDFYSKIGYLDRHATIRDMDKVLEILEKKAKTPFEKFLCSQPMGTSDAYNDLKGTIAFRNNNLTLAYKTFSKIQDSFWTKNYEFGYYLNRDPFFPRCWEWQQTKRPAYVFSKTKFVKELIDLTKESQKENKNQTEIFLKLGHAYYNCSYWGNAWMMVNYGKAEYSFDVELFGSMLEQQKLMQNGNYLNCSIAIDYYRKAWKLSKSREQKAEALYMLHICEYNKCEFYRQNASTKQTDKPKTDTYLNLFYAIYRDTKTFEKLRCPLLDAFVGYKR
jgi:hypothetical protein